MCKISVIIPVYNSSNSLNRMIDSLYKQSNKDFEVIFVDDGSTDGSAQIIRNIESTKIKYEYYYQSNSGVSKARNLGIKNSNGKYIMFIDPDDYIEQNFIQLGIDLIQNSDLGIFSFVSEQDITKQVIFKPKFKKVGWMDQTGFLNQFMNLFDEQLLHALWNKVYKRSIIEDNDIEFPSIRMGEDLDFNFRYFYHVKSANISEEMTYHYITYNTGTATTVYHGDEFESNYKNQMSLIEFLKKNKIYDARRLSLHWALMLGFRFAAIRKLKKSNDPNYIKARNQYEEILKKYKQENWVIISALPFERLVKYIIMISFLRNIYI